MPLGRWHDWSTLTQTAKQRIGDIHQSSLVAALHNVTRGKYREAVAQGLGHGFVAPESLASLLPASGTSTLRFSSKPALRPDLL